MVAWTVYVVVLMLFNVNIEGGVRRTSTACFRELKAFSVSKTTSNVSIDSTRICSTTTTAFECCNQPIEIAMKTHINKRVTLLVYDRNKDAKREVDAVYDAFKGFSENVLHETSESAVKYLQTQSATTANIALDVAPHIRTFFAELQEYLTKRDTKTSIANTTNTFFKNFFPPLYRKQIIQHKSGLPPDFKQCLKDKLHLIYPFQNVPKQITLMLERDLSAVRAFLHGLHTAGQVLEDMNDMKLSGNCTNYLVKMTYCSLCNNITNTKPCPNYCLDIISKCLQPYSNIQPYWDILMKSLNELSFILTKSLDATELFRKLQEKFSNAMSNAFLSKDKVTIHCGSIKAYGVNKIVRLKQKQKDAPTREIDNGDLFLAGDSQNIYANLPTHHDGEEQLRLVRSNLSEFKHFFGNVSYSLCANETFKAVDQYNCWNGTSKGRYDGLFNVKNNMKPNNSDFVVRGVLQLLHTAKQDIQSVISRENIGESSSGEFVASASGSGNDWSGEGGIKPVYQHSGGCDDSDDCDYSGEEDDADEKVLKSNETSVETTPMSTLSTGDAGKNSCHCLLTLFFLSLWLFIWR